MMCMSGAIADFVGRDLAADSANLIVSSGGDSYIRCMYPLAIHLYAWGSPWHDKLALALPPLKKMFGISTYSPGRGAHSVTVLSRTAAWASAYATDIGVQLAAGAQLKSVLDKAETYADVGGVVIIQGGAIVVCGDLVLKAAEQAA
jgi:ApbE superfamily uncharacterized protein (UPF0280 family)